MKKIQISLAEENNSPNKSSKNSTPTKAENWRRKTINLITNAMKTKLPNLKTDRILLHEITDTDLKNVFNGLSHPEVIGITALVTTAWKPPRNRCVGLPKNNNTGRPFVLRITRGFTAPADSMILI